MTAHIASSRRSDAHEPAAQGRYTQHPLLASRAALSRREVADLLGISLRTVDNWISQGRIKAVKLSERCTRIPVADVLRLIGTQPIPSSVAVVDQVLEKPVATLTYFEARDRDMTDREPS